MMAVVVGGGRLIGYEGRIPQCIETKVDFDSHPKHLSPTPPAFGIEQIM